VTRVSETKKLLFFQIKLINFRFFIFFSRGNKNFVVVPKERLVILPFGVELVEQNGATCNNAFLGQVYFA